MAGYRSPWIGLTEAIVRVACNGRLVTAWPQIKSAIADSELPARGHLDGVDGDIDGNWISILAFDTPERDCLWFRNEKWHRIKPPAPELAERVKVDGRYLDKLWPHSADAAAIFTKQHWSLWQLLAWAHRKDAALVAEYPRHSDFWYIEASDIPEGAPSFEVMQEGVLNRLRSGELGSVDLANGTPREIETSEWSESLQSPEGVELRFIDEPLCATNERESVVYPVFPIEQILKIWPVMDGKEPEAGSDAPPAAQSVRGVTRVASGKLYIARMAAVEEESGRLPTAESDEDWRQKEGISRPRIRELRKNLRPSNSKSGGAPRKKT